MTEETKDEATEAARAEVDRLTEWFTGEALVAIDALLAQEVPGMARPPAEHVALARAFLADAIRIRMRGAAVTVMRDTARIARVGVEEALVFADGDAPIEHVREILRRTVARLAAEDAS